MNFDLKGYWKKPFRRNRKLGQLLGIFGRGKFYEYAGIRVEVRNSTKIDRTERRRIRERFKEINAISVRRFEKDFRGQSEVLLVFKFMGEQQEHPHSDLEKNWIDYLSTNETKIKKLGIPKVGNKVLQALSNQKQLRELTLYKVDQKTDLSFLRNLPNLEELTMQELRRGVDLSVLMDVPSLKGLILESTHIDIDTQTISKLDGLRALELGDPSPGSLSYIRIPSFEFLEPLINMHTLNLHNLRPATKNYSSLAKLKNVESLSYAWERGQTPSVEALASHSLGLQKVAERKAEWELKSSQPGFYEWKPVK